MLPEAISLVQLEPMEGDNQFCEQPIIQFRENKKGLLQQKS